MHMCLCIIPMFLQANYTYKYYIALPIYIYVYNINVYIHAYTNMHALNTAYITCALSNIINIIRRIMGRIKG